MAVGKPQKPDSPFRYAGEFDRREAGDPGTLCRIRNLIYVAHLDGEFVRELFYLPK